MYKSEIIKLIFIYNFKRHKQNKNVKQIFPIISTTAPAKYFCLKQNHGPKLNVYGAICQTTCKNSSNQGNTRLINYN